MERRDRKARPLERKLITYWIADVGGGHGLRVVVDVLELAVDQVVIGALAGADAVVDVVERQHLTGRLGHEAHRRVRSHASLAVAQRRRFATVLQTADRL